MADGKRGRRPDSDAMKAAKAQLRSAENDEARAAAHVAIDALKAREKAARIEDANRNLTAAMSDAEVFTLLVEVEPRVRRAEEIRDQAVEQLKEEHQVLAKALGGMAAARRRLELFRRAQTEEGQAEARALIDMRRRVAERQAGAVAASALGEPRMHAAA